MRREWLTLMIAAVAAALGWELHQQTEEVHRLWAELATKSSQPPVLRDSQPISILREKCAARAREFFDELNKDTTVSYRNHYNPTLKTCFVTITSLTYGLTMSLLDAYELREYAFYFESFKFGKVTCTLTPRLTDVASAPSNGAAAASERFCESKAEFDAFVAMYME